MPHNSGSEQEPDDPDADPEFVEVDPSGRYGRYKEALGKGAFKKVYRAFDELEGIEVAWNQVKVADLLRNSVDVDRDKLYSEVHLLKTLKHKNIIKFYNSWLDAKNENINFITEVFTSGTLRQYRKKHKHCDLRALKKWSRQILEGLSYLHSHDPPVIHRDLKCDNIFVNGNQGEVKIGDLGLAAMLHQARSAHSVIGTPEFMAPELYEEEYNELVDIYAFGMCLLELVTFEYPYSECTNAAQIFKKVTAGIKPASLSKVKDPNVKAFIENCTAQVSERLSARDLLMHPFLHSVDVVGPSTQYLLLSAPYSDGSDEPIGIHHIDSVLKSGRDITIEGQRKDLNTIFLKLRIADATGLFRNIHFPFDIEADTAIAVASEMVEELDLTDQDVSAIAEMINSEIRSYISDWEPQNHADTIVAGDLATSDSGTIASPHTLHSSPHSELVLERLPSGHIYWCDSPKEGDATSPHRLGPSNLSHTGSSTPIGSWNGDQSSESHYQNDESTPLGSPKKIDGLSPRRLGPSNLSHTDSSAPSENLNEEIEESSDFHNDESDTFDSPKEGDVISPCRLGPSNLSHSDSSTPRGSLNDEAEHWSDSHNDESNPLDSPKEGDGISPHRLGPSNLSRTGSSTPKESLNETEQSSDCHNDENNPLDSPMEGDVSSPHGLGPSNVLHADSSAASRETLNKDTEQLSDCNIEESNPLDSPKEGDATSLHRLVPSNLSHTDSSTPKESLNKEIEQSLDCHNDKSDPLNSPKEGDETSPDGLGPSNLSHTDTSMPIESLNEETEQSSNCHNDESNPLDAGSPQLTESQISGNELGNTISASELDIISCTISSDQNSSKGSPKLEETNEVNQQVEAPNEVNQQVEATNEVDQQVEETNEVDQQVEETNEVDQQVEETDEVDQQAKIIADKLDQLLAEQQSELDEILKRHELAVSEFFKEFSPEIHEKIIEIHKQKIRDHKLQCKALLATSSFKASGSSVQTIIKGIHFTRGCSMERAFKRDDALVPVVSYSPSSLKRRINSSTGIAVILGNDQEEC